MINQSPMINQSIATPVGQLLAVWTEENKLYSCEFAETNRSPVKLEQALDLANNRGFQPTDSPPTDLPPSCLGPLQQLLAERLDQYFSTGCLEWDWASLDWRAITPFHREVLECCAQIAAGQTLTYGQLAARAGRPRAARAVGSAMARNRWPLIIPCHRVVGSDGRLTGYSGTGGIETKRRLLGLEAGELLLALA